MEVLAHPQTATDRWPPEGQLRQGLKAQNTMVMRTPGKNAKDELQHEVQRILRKARGEEFRIYTRRYSGKLWPLLSLGVVVVFLCVSCARFARFLCLLNVSYVEFKRIKRQFCHLISIWPAQGGRAPI